MLLRCSPEKRWKEPLELWPRWLKVCSGPLFGRNRAIVAQCQPRVAAVAAGFGEVQEIDRGGRNLRSLTCDEGYLLKFHHARATGMLALEKHVHEGAGRYLHSLYVQKWRGPGRRNLGSFAGSRPRVNQDAHAAGLSPGKRRDVRRHLLDRWPQDRSTKTGPPVSWIALSTHA